MKLWVIISLLAAPGAAWAAKSSALSLDAYLQDVQSKNPDARSTLQSISSLQLRLDEGEAPLLTQAYGQFGLRDDQKPTAQPIFMGDETRTTQWRLGLKKQTSFGLGADLYVNSQRTVVSDASPSFLPINDYLESSAVLELKQSLWRNGFGEATRAQIAEAHADTESQLLQSRFKLKTILMNARDMYWTVVSYNEIVKLQQENVERARRLRDYMNKRAKMRLFDDTDAMQSESAFQTRQLELQSSLDERAAAVRKLNSLRGLDEDAIGDLDPLPAEELTAAALPSARMVREDFQSQRAGARAALAKTRDARSQIQPELNVEASFATNGRDGMTSRSFDQMQTDHYPTWSVGLNFSFPLDFALVRDISHGYAAAQRSAQEADAQASFAQERAWNDLVKQNREAQNRFERAVEIEKLQTRLVARERQRLMNGRATTFEALNLEQNLALSQIQRVRAQLALLQIHDALKTFEAEK